MIFGYFFFVQQVISIRKNENQLTTNTVLTVIREKMSKKNYRVCVCVCVCVFRCEGFFYFLVVQEMSRTE